MGGARRPHARYVHAIVLGSTAWSQPTRRTSSRRSSPGSSSGSTLRDGAALRPWIAQTAELRGRRTPPVGPRDSGGRRAGGRRRHARAPRRGADGPALDRLAGLPRDPRPVLLPRRELPRDRRGARTRPGRSRNGSPAASRACGTSSTPRRTRRRRRKKSGARPVGWKGGKDTMTPEERIAELLRACPRPRVGGSRRRRSSHGTSRLATILERVERDDAPRARRRRPRVDAARRGHRADAGRRRPPAPAASRREPRDRRALRRRRPRREAARRPGRGRSRPRRRDVLQRSPRRWPRDSSASSHASHRTGRRRRGSPPRRPRSAIAPLRSRTTTTEVTHVRSCSFVPPSATASGGLRDAAEVPARIAEAAADVAALAALAARRCRLRARRRLGGGNAGRGGERGRRPPRPREPRHGPTTAHHARRPGGPRRVRRARGRAPGDMSARPVPAWSLSPGDAPPVAASPIWSAAVTRGWAYGGSDGAVDVCIVDSGVERDAPSSARSRAPSGDPRRRCRGRGRRARRRLRPEDCLRGHPLAGGCRLHSVRVLGAGATGTADLILAGLRHAIERAIA